MAALQATDIADLVLGTLRDLGKLKVTDISTDIQEHVAMRNLLKKNRIVFDSGRGFQWQVRTNYADTAQFVGLYNQDQVNASDVLKSCTMEWRHVVQNWAFDHHEVDMNSGAARIVDIVKERRHSAMIGLAEKMEYAFWRVPAVSNTTDPHGVPYYIVKNNSEGFNGGHPSGYSDVASLSSTTYPRWKNYTAQYTDVTKADLIAKWRKAATYTKWIPPVDGMPTYNTGDMYGFYTNYAVIAELESVLESQNDNLGNDIASKDGQTMFRRTPVTWIPLLNDDSNNPVYGINWGVFKTAILKNWWLKEHVEKNVGGQHNVCATFLDCSFEWICYDRRRNMVLALDTTDAV
jgi:hypothetical protein